MAKTLVPSAYMRTSPLCPLPPALLLCIFNARQLTLLLKDRQSIDREAETLFNRVHEIE